MNLGSTDELDEGELEGINLELEGYFSLRQFISLTDDEGEDGFIPFNQTIGYRSEAIFSEEDQD